MARGQMADKPQVKFCSDQLMGSDDEEFENTVQSLDMRGLLDMVTSLQGSMAEEQRTFDDLSAKLQRHPDSNSTEHQKTSYALCASQMRLARLCTRNMRCFTQQALRAKKEQWRSSPTDDSSERNCFPTVTVDKMASPAMQNGNGEKPSSGFRENLRFFQNQVNAPNPGFASTENSDIYLGGNRGDPGTKAKPKLQNSRSGNSVPSVDNILSQVKSIRAAQNFGNSLLEDSQNSRFQTQRTMSTDTREWSSMREHQGRTVVCDTRKTSSKGDARTLVASSPSSIINHTESETKNNTTHKAHTFSGREHQSRLSNGFGSALSSKGETQNQHDRIYVGAVCSGNESSYTTKNGFTKTASSNEASRSRVESEDISHCKTSLSDKSAVRYALSSYDGRGSGTRPTGETMSQGVVANTLGPHEVILNVSKADTSIPGQMSRVAMHNGFPSVPQNKLASISGTESRAQESYSRTKNPSNVLDDSKRLHTPPKSGSPTVTDGQSEKWASHGMVNLAKDGDEVRLEDESEKRSDSLESDLDSKDFVVHKASFPEDYLEAMSEEAYSSLNEEYEVEHPEGNDSQPNIPSPDYESDEEIEYEVHRTDGRYDDDEDDDGEFIDNSAQYVSDPRRYVYYQDDKELEVIPEEDEDDIDDDDEYNASDHSSPDSCSQGYSDRDKDDLCLPLPDGKSPSGLLSHQQQAECDSGVTDDQRSSSSIAEDCDLDEDDTDSAKGGSLLQADSSSESPTHPERRPSPTQRDYLPRIPHSSEITYGESRPNKQDMGSKKIAVVSPGLLSDRKISSFIDRHPQNDKGVWKDNEIVDEMRQPRSTTGSWDPTDLLKELYRLDYPDEPKLCDRNGYINMEGYLDKLPSGRRKATYWNPWKKRYFRLRDGFLHCYDSQNSEKATTALQLMGGNIDTLENNMIGVDDKKGHYVVVRCTSLEESERWVSALLTQCSEDFTSAYTQPVRHPLSLYKDVIIIDLGSSSVRAGILMESPTLPQLFFPTVCATDKVSLRREYGVEALRPDIRKNSQISFPVYPSAKVTKYTMDVIALPGLLKKVFVELNVDPQKYKVQMSIPRSFSLQTQIKVAKILLEEFGVKAINLTHQAILSLYAYNASSGIVVDIGDRMDILPINDGYIVEGGVTRLPYGGLRIIHHLKHALAQKHVSLVSDVESYLARHVLEQLCYIAEDYKEEVHRFHMDPDNLEMSISTSHLFQGECPCEEIILDSGRFQVPEGLFTPELWGLDNPGVHKLVYRAIQECSVDVRTEMSRSIYVSGGVTLLPGFVDRLQGELDKLTPAKVIPKVHCSPHRYHMAYLGACRLATSEGFEEVCVTKEEWRRRGNVCLQKWHL